MVNSLSSHHESQRVKSRKSEPRLFSRTGFCPAVVKRSITHRCPQEQRRNTSSVGLSGRFKSDVDVVLHGLLGIDTMACSNRNLTNYFHLRRNLDEGYCSSSVSETISLGVADALSRQTVPIRRTRHFCLCEYRGAIALSAKGADLRTCGRG
jgi:hypothetical protein